MVAASLSIAGVVGVVLSGGFVYWEVGRYATPQVPETLFDERREIFAYTAGLFVGVPLALPFLFYLLSMSHGALPGALLFLALLVIGTEVAQRVLLNTRYFGAGRSGPFYALGFRAGIGGILVLALLAEALGAATVSVPGVVLAGLQSVAIIALEAAGALLSIRTLSPATVGPRGGPLPGAIVSAIGFFLLGFGSFYDVDTGIAGALLALAGALVVYRRLRSWLGRIPPPTVPRPLEGPLPESRFRRTER